MRPCSRSPPPGTTTRWGSSSSATVSKNLCRPGRAGDTCFGCCGNCSISNRRGAGTDITGALQYLARVVRRRAVVFVVSDFLGDGYEKALAVAGRRHDTVAIRMSDPREHQLPPVGYLELEDAETGEHVTVDVSDPAFRAAFKADVAEKLTARERQFRKSRVDVVEITTRPPVCGSAHAVLSTASQARSMISIRPGGGAGHGARDGRWRCRLS